MYQKLAGMKDWYLWSAAFVASVPGQGSGSPDEESSVWPAISSKPLERRAALQHGHAWILSSLPCIHCFDEARGLTKAQGCRGLLKRCRCEGSAEICRRPDGLSRPNRPHRLRASSALRSGVERSRCLVSDGSEGLGEENAWRRQKDKSMKGWEPFPAPEVHWLPNIHSARDETRC